MVQQVLQAVAVNHSLDALIDNASITTHWEQIGSDTLVNQTTVINRIKAFFNTLPTGSTAEMASYMSRCLDRSTNASFIELYDITGHLDGTPHGAPIAISHFTLGPPITSTNDSLPEGVAATLSYRVDYGLDPEFSVPPGARMRARDRNRFYLGPLRNLTIQNAAVTNRAQFTPAFMSDLLRSAGALLAAGTGTTDVTTPVVWSRRAAAVKHPITQVWCDDRPDYQRRRSDPSVKVFS